MPAYRQGAVNPEERQEASALPTSTIEYIANGAPEGDRNNTLLKAACQMRDAGHLQADIEGTLIPRAVQDGLSEREAERTIRSAYSREPREPIVTGRKIIPFAGYARKQAEPELKFKKIETKPEPMPDYIPNGWRALLEAAFEPEEFVAIGGTFETDGGKYKPDKGVTMSQKEWLKHFGRRRGGVTGYEGENGVFIRINPMFDEGFADKDVAGFRHALIECDQGSKEEQLGALRKIGLPIAAIIDSGGKSVHAWVRIDAAHEVEYRERVALLHRFCRQALGLEIDPANKNPSRYSRMPEGLRTRMKDGKPVLGEDGKPIIDFQRLLAVKVPGKPWEKWIEFEDVPIDDGLPDELDWSESIEKPAVEPKHIIKDFLRLGQVLIITGGSKTNKSWTMMEMAIAVSQGAKFLKWEAHQSKVYYADTELEGCDFDRRGQRISKAKELAIDRGEISKLLLRGYPTTLDELVPALIRRLKGKGYELICIDAIYSVLGNREENANEDIAQIGGLLFRLARETGAAVAFTHHHSKGSQQGKRGIEKASGAGA